MAERIGKFLPDTMDSNDSKLNPDNFYQVRKYGGKLIYYARIKDNNYWFIANDDKNGKDRATEFMINTSLDSELNFSLNNMKDLLRVSRRLR